MDFVSREHEWTDRAARFIKAELKRANMTYDELAERLKKHGFKETKASIANKLARESLPAAFFLACLAAMELEGVGGDLNLLIAAAAFDDHQRACEDGNFHFAVVVFLRCYRGHLTIFSGLRRRALSPRGRR